MITFAVRAPLPWKYEFLIPLIHVAFELFLKGAILFFSQELCVRACLNYIHFEKISPVHLALIGVLVGHSDNGLQKCTC